MAIPNIILTIIKPARQLKHWSYCTARYLTTLFAYKNFKRKHEAFCYSIPIIINNRNRLTYLKRLISSLENKGYKNLYIIDNDSDYPPLLAYYEIAPYKVYRLNKNAGYCAIWETNIINDFKDGYYVYTDSDLEIIDKCPDDFMTFFYFLLHKYKQIGKAGFGLKTDDLPNSYAFKNKVVNWEASVLRKGRRLEKYAIKAQIDTTFALYRKGCFGPASAMEAIRTTYPFVVKHLPWYEDTDNLNEEQTYYYNSTLTSSHWSKAVKNHLNI
ncbi:MAG TPA: glycosyltransferase family A protein [Chitinophagaceae bacterium]|nr:glycosyltransferase family A protein [Chitinophagaceae bacterium]